MNGGREVKLPWDGKPAPADKVLVVAILLSGLYSLATLPLIPWMLQHHPVLLAGLRGGMTAIVNLGALARVGEVNLLVAILVGLPATIMFDWAYWWAGQRWGERGLHMMLGNSARTEARLARARRWIVHYRAPAVLFAYFLPVPTFLVYAAAGWSGMGLGLFLVLDILGGLLWVALLAGLGYWIGQNAVDVVDAIADYTLWITLGLVVLVVVRQVWVARRGTPAHRHRRTP